MNLENIQLLSIYTGDTLFDEYEPEYGFDLLTINYLKHIPKIVQWRNRSLLGITFDELDINISILFFNITINYKKT